MAEENRRSFLKWVVNGLGAIFAVILGAPAVMYLVDARNRKPRESGFRPVEGVNLAELEVGQVKQGLIRDIRRDAWTLHPSDVIGRVWVVKEGPAADALDVFTTVCPHLGCSINLSTLGAQPVGFLCPCHNAEFNLDGTKVEGRASNPAPRGMDKLVWHIDPTNRARLLVDYVNFKQLEPTPIPKT